MSSTFVADTVDDKDESLIIIVNPDGTITVDPETLQKLIANQHRGNVSVVRMDGEGGGGSGGSQSGASGSDGATDDTLNLTVEGFFPPPPPTNATAPTASSPVLQHVVQHSSHLPTTTTASVNDTTSLVAENADETVVLTSGDGGEVVVDPFSQMDPEQLARLETALQSEQAKEILGHNLSGNIIDVGDVVLDGVRSPPTVLESVVHNDHSYTTIVHNAPPPVLVHQQQQHLLLAEQFTSSTNGSTSQGVHHVERLKESVVAVTVTTTTPTTSIPTASPTTRTRGGRGRGRGRGGGGAGRNSTNAAASTRQSGSHQQVVRTLHQQLILPTISTATTTVPQTIVVSKSNGQIAVAPTVVTSAGNKVLIQQSPQQGANFKFVSSTAESITATPGSTPGTKILHRRVLLSKTPVSASSQVQSQHIAQQAKTPVSIVHEQKNAVVVNQNSEIVVVKKGTFVRRGGSIAGGRGRGRRQVTSGGNSTNNNKEIVVVVRGEARDQTADSQSAEDEIVVPAEKEKQKSKAQPATSPLVSTTAHSTNEKNCHEYIGDSQQNTDSASLDNIPEPVKKRETNVILKKLSNKVDKAAHQTAKSTGTRVKERPGQVPITSRKSADSTTLPSSISRGGSKIELQQEDGKKKKESVGGRGVNGSKGGHHHQGLQAGAVVLGPELFSTPDIIRRVPPPNSSSSTPATPTTPTTPTPTPSSSSPDIKPNTTTSPPVTTATNQDDMTPETLLDSIHAEVAKVNNDDSGNVIENRRRSASISASNSTGAALHHFQDNKLLTEALLLDDLTNDDTTVTTVESEVMNSHIEETLEQMEASGLSVKTVTVVDNSKNHNGHENVVLTKPSANSKQDMLKGGKTPIKKHNTIKEKRVSTDSVKQSASSSGRKRKVTEKAALLLEEEMKRRKRATVTEESEMDNEPIHQTPARQRLHVAPTPKTQLSDDDEDDDDDNDEESWNSEDDPDRLWCICQKPHNNRFMICCDTCEDWFHGKCVGITKALGQQMEQRGIEWSCPNCRKLKEGDSVVTPTTSHQTALPSATTASSQLLKKTSEQTRIGSLECLVCKKPARANSIYCSDTCIRKHVLNMLVIIKKETDRLQPTSRVIVYEKKSGRILSGEKAPTVECLVDWLLNHQTFEVVRPSSALLVKATAPATAQHATTTTNPAKSIKNKLVRGNGVGALKQTVLMAKGVGPGGTPPKMVYSAKPKIQLIQPQPQVVSTTKGGGGKAETASGEQSGNGVLEHNGKKKIVRQSSLTSSVETTSSSAPVSSTSSGSQHTVKSNNSNSISYTNSSTNVSSIIVKKQQQQQQQQAPLKKEKKQRKESISETKTSGNTVPTSTSTTTSDVTTTIPGAVNKSKEEPEPIRSNVKRTLHELLTQRAKQDTKINITDEEIKNLTSEIEEELFNYFKDTGFKYKAKYRSLVFNIKDPKNLTLYKKILEKSVSPARLVTLTPEELASQELAQWREKEAKHQIEIIKKNELDLIHQAKTVVLKSRKGEEVIETKNHEANISELESALNRTAEDYDETLDKNTSTVKEEKKEADSELLKLEEKLKSRDKKKDDRHRKKDRKKDDRKDDKRDRGRSHSHRSKSKKKSRSRSRRRSRSRSRERDKVKDKGHEEKPIEEEKKITEEIIGPEVETEGGNQLEEETLEGSGSLVGNGASGDSDASSSSGDREPTSTVIINTPPYLDTELEGESEDNVPTVWKGSLNMTEVTKLYTKAYEVSGACDNLASLLPEHLECVGRIQPDSVWDYVARMKKAGTKNIVVIRFAADGERENINYLSLYSYLNSRNRMAVIGNVSKGIKDFYVLPLASHSPIPQVLLPLDGPGFEDYRPHLLLGIIIRSRKGTHSELSSSFTIRTKSKRGGARHRSKTPERSYTPPLPSSDGPAGLPLPAATTTAPPLLNHSMTPPLLTPDDDEPYSPGGDDDDPYSPGGGEDPEETSPIGNVKLSVQSSVNQASNQPAPDLQRNLEEVNRMIEQKRLQIESIAAASAVSSPPPSSTYKDDEEAYSPSESFTPPPPTSSDNGGSTGTADAIPFFDSKSLPDINLPSNLQEILASIKSSSSGGGMRSQSAQDTQVGDPIVKAYKMYNRKQKEDDEEEEAEEKTVSTGSPPAKVNNTGAPEPGSSGGGSRDPRQRQSQQQGTTGGSGGALLSRLSDDELIRKAAVEMEQSRGPPPPSVAPEDPLQHQAQYQNHHYYQGGPTVSAPLPPAYHRTPYQSYSHQRSDEYPPCDYDSEIHRSRVGAPDVPRRGGVGRGGRRGPQHSVRGTPRHYRGGGPHYRGYPGNYYPAPPHPHPRTHPLPHHPDDYDGIRSEWEEEIRNFEQRKGKRTSQRKRISSRSPSPSSSRSPPSRRPRLTSPHRRRSHT